MGRNASIALTVIAASVLIASQPPSTRAEESITRAQADEIISELRQMRILLERLGSQIPSGRPAGAPGNPVGSERVKVGIGSTPALGSNDAPMTIVEFTDYQCPFCQQFHMTAFQDVKRDYVDAGKVRYASRDLPLAMHPNAMSAAHVARCAGEQNKFWEMRSGLIANANQLGTDQYTALADELNLDLARFQNCLAAVSYTHLTLPTN